MKAGSFIKLELTGNLKTLFGLIFKTLIMKMENNRDMDRRQGRDDR